MKTYIVSRIFFAVLLVVSFFLPKLPCEADQATFAYAGIVDGATGGSEFDALLGEQFFFQFTFDPSAPDAEPSDNMVGLFNAISSIQACIGPGGETASYHEDTGNVTLTDSASPDISGDVYEVDGLTFGSGTPIGGFGMTNVGLSLFDETGNAFNNDMLTSLQPNPIDFSSGRLLIEWGNGAGRITASKFRIVDPINVPEPSATLALLTSLLTIGSVRRSR